MLFVITIALTFAVPMIVNEILQEIYRKENNFPKHKDCAKGRRLPLDPVKLHRILVHGYLPTVGLLSLISLLLTAHSSGDIAHAFIAWFLFLILFSSAIVFTKLLIEKGDKIAFMHDEYPLKNSQEPNNESIKTQESTIHEWIKHLHNET